VGGRQYCVIPFTRANLSALQMSTTHIIKCYTNVLLTLHSYIRQETSNTTTIAITILTVVFQVNNGQPVPSWLSSSTCCGREPFKIVASRFFAGRMTFLLGSQPCQSTVGNLYYCCNYYYLHLKAVFPGEAGSEGYLSGPPPPPVPTPVPSNRG